MTRTLSRRRVAALALLSGLLGGTALDNSPDSSWFPGSEFGLGIGDVNGDGLADFAIERGVLEVYHGDASGIAASPSTTADILDPVSGSPVEAAGDVNGDGYDDLLVYVGPEVRIYHGGPSGISGTPAPDAVLTKTGGGPFGMIGAAGDLDADGYDDVATWVDVGSVAIFHGSATGIGTRETSAADATLTTAANNYPFNFLGGDIAPAGDVNGDGYGDLLLGPWTLPGVATLYLGGPAGVPSGDLETDAATVFETATSAFWPQSVASAGDVNGDGYDDVLIGRSTTAESSRRARLFLGGAAGIPSGADAAAAHTFVGYEAVSGAGDVDGDGYDDVLVADRFHCGLPEGYCQPPPPPFQPDPDWARGRAALHFGFAGGIDETRGPIQFSAVHFHPAAGIGVILDGLGDVNGDGFDDILLGRLDGTADPQPIRLYLGGDAVVPIPALTAGRAALTAVLLAAAGVALLRPRDAQPA